MNLIAYESVDQPIIEILRQDGYEVVSIAEVKSGIADTEVLMLANQRQALLITADRDFGELVFRQEQIHTGVLLIRLAGLSPQAKAAIVSEAFKAHGNKFLQAFGVISPGTVRIRRRM